jgi:hypothetical protein
MADTPCSALPSPESLRLCKLILQPVKNGLFFIVKAASFLKDVVFLGWNWIGKEKCRRRESHRTFPHGRSSDHLGIRVNGDY